MKQIGNSGLVAACALAAFAATAAAQVTNPYFRANMAYNGVNPNAYSNMAAANPGIGFNPAAYAYGGLPFGYGNNVFVPDPFSGYLNGAGNVINAQGQYMVQAQQANVIKQQSKSAKLDNQRKAFDEWMYERDRTPTAEDERVRSQMEQLRRSLNDPPVTEIWSAKTLNEILADVQKRQAGGSGIRGPDIPLDESIVGHINVSTGVSTASIGPLKSGGKLSWPVLLKNSYYKEDRDRMNELAPKVLREAADGNLEPDTINGMTESINNLYALLKSQIRDVPSNQYIAAKRYVNELNDAVKVLQSDEASKFVTRSLSAKGNSVGELVDNMTKQGLKFAAATSGDQTAYTALHSAMVQYDMGLTQMVATMPRNSNQR